MSGTCTQELQEVKNPGYSFAFTLIRLIFSLTIFPVFFSFQVVKMIKLINILLVFHSSITQIKLVFMQDNEHLKLRLTKSREFGQLQQSTLLR